MFPKKLDRIPYLIRWIIWIALLGILFALVLPLIDFHGGSYQWAFWLVLTLVVVLRVLCLDIPRMKSIGWNPWILLLFPLTGGIGQLLLFFMPAKKEPPQLP
jgi:hypothetical protein